MDFWMQLHSLLHEKYGIWSLQTESFQCVNTINLKELEKAIINQAIKLDFK